MILDTNVISEALYDSHSFDAAVLRYADNSDYHLHTHTVDDELKRVTDRKRPGLKEKVDAYRYKIRKDRVRSRRIGRMEWEEYPVVGNDKRILHDAVVHGVKVIVTMDKKFRKKGNGYKGISVIEPYEYMNSKKRSSRKKD